MKYIFSVFMLFSLSLSADQFQEKRDLKTIHEVLDVWNDVKRSIPEDQILFVFDIDNTLLQQVRELGSDDWFALKEAAIKGDPVQNQAAEFDELIHETDIFRICMPTVTPEDATRPTLLTLIRSKSPVIGLTSRSPGLMKATFRSLHAQALDIWHSKAKAPTFLGNPRVEALSADEIQKFNLLPNQVRPIGLSHNIIFSAGQNKGGILKAYIKQILPNAQAIIFVDDTQKHIDRMYDAFTGTNIRLESLHYTYTSYMKAGMQAFDKDTLERELREYVPCKEAKRELGH